MLPCKMRPEKQRLYFFFGNMHSLNNSIEVLLKESYFQSSKIVFRNINNVENEQNAVQYGKQI